MPQKAIEKHREHFNNFCNNADLSLVIWLHKLFLRCVEGVRDQKSAEIKCSYASCFRDTLGAGHLHQRNIFFIFTSISNFENQLRNGVKFGSSGLLNNLCQWTWVYILDFSLNGMEFVLIFARNCLHFAFKTLTRCSIQSGLYEYVYNLQEHLPIPHIYVCDLTLSTKSCQQRM